MYVYVAAHFVHVFWSPPWKHTLLVASQLAGTTVHLAWNLVSRSSSASFMTFFRAAYCVCVGVDG